MRKIALGILFILSILSKILVNMMQARTLAVLLFDRACG